MKNLFIAPSTRGYGESVLGLRLAEQLRRDGDEITFLAHKTAQNVLQGNDFKAFFVPDHAMKMIPFYLLRMISEFQPDTIVLSDYFTTWLALERAGTTLDLISRHDIPVVAIDTWDFNRCGFEIDLYGEPHVRVPDWRSELDARLIPAPMGDPSCRAGVYSSIPTVNRVTGRIRGHVRGDLGLAEDDRAILFCTSAWQMADFSDERAVEVTRTMPELLAHYCRSLGPRVTIVHVGPEPLEQDWGGRYYWMPPLPGGRFEALVGSVDVLLTLNISATTIGTALAHGVPVVNLQNSHRLSSTEELLDLVRGHSPGVREWAEGVRCLYPFLVWPLGFYDFLRPLLDTNGLLNAVHSVEILDEERVLETLGELLFRPETRDDARQRQHRYLERLESLAVPSRTMNDVARIPA